MSMLRETILESQVEALAEQPFTSMDAAMSQIAEFQQERKELEQAFSIRTKVEELREYSDGCSPTMLLTAVNQAVETVPSFQIQFPSMESVEDQQEIAMEGISEILSKIRSYIGSKIKGIKDKLAKTMKAFKYVFKDQYAKFNDLETRLTDDRYKLKTGELEVPVAVRPYLQSAGKPIDLMTAMREMSRMSQAEYDDAILDKMIASISGKSWASYQEALIAYSEAYKIFLREAHQTTSAAKGVIEVKQAGYLAFATALTLPKGFQAYTVVREYTLPDGKAKAYRLVNQGVVTDTVKVSNKAKVDKVEAFDAATISAICKMCSEMSDSNGRHWEDLYRRYDGIEKAFDVLETVSGDLDMTRDQYSNLVDLTYSVYYGALWHMEGYFDFQIPCLNNVVKHIKNHFE